MMRLLKQALLTICEWITLQLNFVVGSSFLVCFKNIFFEESSYARDMAQVWLCGDVVMNLGKANIIVVPN